VLFGDRYERHEFPQARIGDDDIDSASRSDRLVEAVQVAQIGHVPPHAARVVTDLPHGIVELPLAAARDEDIGTFGRKELRQASPMPAVPPVMTATFPCNLPMLVAPLLTQCRLTLFYSSGGALSMLTDIVMM